MIINFKSAICKILVLALVLSSLSCALTGITVSAETTEKIIFTDDFERDDTELSSNTANGAGYGIGNGWEEGTYGGANILDGKLILSAAGNMASKKYQSHRLMRPDSEATLNQSVSITIDVSEVTSSSMPVLWLRLQPVTWGRTTATGYFVYTNGSQVYFAKSVGGTYSGIASPYCSFGSIAQGEVTITFSATQKDATTTTLSYAVSGIRTDGTEFNYNWLSYDDTTAELQSAGNVGLSFINANSGTMAINSFTYSTTDTAVPVPVVTDDFSGETLSPEWSGTKEGIFSLENGSMAIGFGGSYDSSSRINNRVQYNSSAISQFVEVEVPVSDIDNMNVAEEGASYPVLWLRDQTVNGAQIGYFADYNGTGLSINRRNADGTVTTIASSAYFVLNGSNTYATDDNVIFQFSAKGTNPTVLTARIYASFSATEEQPSMVCSVTGTDSDQSLEIETAGVPSIAIRRTASVTLPLHIEKFVYYTYGALDYSSLNNAIAFAEEIIEKSEEYRADSISGLAEAIATAKSVLSVSGISQSDVNNAADTLQAEISKAVRFPSVKNIEVNDISATVGENNTFSVELSATCNTADFSIDTTFDDGVTVTVSDGTEQGNILPFTQNEKSYTVTVTYNGESENYTVNAVRGANHAVVAKASNNGSITNAGVNYVENGSSMSFTVTPDANYCVKSLLINGAETTLSADNIVEINNIETDYIIEAEFEKLLVMCDSATVSFNQNGGMRFEAFVSDNGIAHLEAQKNAGLISDYTLGTIMLPTDLLVEELTIDSEKVLNIERTVWQTALTDGYSRMTAVLNNIYHKNYEREIMARVYLTVTDANGEENTVYSDVTSATVYDTAKKTLSEDTYTGEYFNILNDFTNPSQKAFTNAQKLLENEKKLTIGYIGGSITLGIHNSYGYDESTGTFSASTEGGDLSKSWANQTSNWFKTQYPDATIETVNAGVSDTATNYGLFRLEKTLMNTNGHDMPDLVFVEFTVNDWIYDTQTASDLETQIESLFRNIYTLNPYAEIAVVVTARSEDVQSRLCYKKVAENYGIPVIDMGIYLSDAINDRLGTSNESAGKYYYTTDNLHPSMFGSEIYFAQIKKYLDTNCTTYTVKDSTLYSYKDNIATALNSNLISSPNIISAVDEKLSISGSAEESAVGIGCRMYGTDYEVETVSLLNSSYKITGETTLTFKFNGTALGLLFQMTTSSINATYSIDGAEAETFAVDDDNFGFQRYAGHAQMWMLKHNLSDSEHTLTITFNDTTDMTVYFAGLLVNSK